MRGCISLILIFFVGMAIITVVDKAGLFNSDPDEVLAETTEELSKALNRTKSEQDKIDLFHKQSSEYIISCASVFRNVKSSLNSSNYRTAEDFDNDINKAQVLQNRITATLNKLSEIELSGDEQRQQLSTILQTELALTENLLESINVKISGGNWRESFAKARMSQEILKLLSLPEELTLPDSKKKNLYDRVKFFREKSGYVKNAVEEMLKDKSEQFKSADAPSEAESSFDLKTLQLLRKHAEITLTTINEADLHYGVVKQKFVALIETEIAMTDNLTVAIEAKSRGEDWQAYLTAIQTLSENFKAIIDELKEIEDKIQGGENLEQPAQSEKTSPENQPQTKPAQMPEEIFPESDKAVVKDFLERKQPFVIVDFGKDMFNVSTPLASNEPKKLEKYMNAVGNSIEPLPNTNRPGLLKAVQACNAYLESEALIAFYYYSLKEESHADGLLDKIGNISGKAALIGNADKLKELYSLQDKAEKEIRSLAKWSDATLYDSIDEAELHGVKESVLEFFR